MGGSVGNGRPQFRRATSAAPLLGASVAGCGVAAALIILRHPGLAGVAALVAATLLVWGTGRARAERRRPILFAELVMDRVFDASILAPLAWVWRSVYPRVSVLALVGLGASFAASYERARGRSLGYPGRETVGYRTVRTAILSIGLLGGWIEGALWAFAALTVTASGVRAMNVARQERRSPHSFDVPA